MTNYLMTDSVLAAVNIDDIKTAQISHNMKKTDFGFKQIRTSSNNVGDV